MNNKRLNIISPEDKKKRRNKIITILSFILIVIIVVLLIKYYINNHDNTKHISKGSTTTTETTTINYNIVTMEQEPTELPSVKTEKTSEVKTPGIQTIYVPSSTTTTEKVNNNKDNNTNTYIYNFKLKDDNYKISICNEKSNAIVGKYSLLLNNEIIGNSTSVDDEIIVDKDTIDLSLKPTIIINIDNKKYNVNYNSKCIVS